MTKSNVVTSLGTFLVVALTTLAGCASDATATPEATGETTAKETGSSCEVVGGNGRCGIRKLICDNRGDVPVMDHDLRGVKGTLKTTHSTFDCWFPKGMHAGGNDIWYWTQSDIATPGSDGWGWVPAVDVMSPIDPMPGLPECGSQDSCLNDD